MMFKYWIDDQTIDDAQLISSENYYGTIVLPLKPFYNLVSSGKTDKIKVNLVPICNTGFIKDEITTHIIENINGKIWTRRIQ